MRVLLISDTEAKGGAAIAAARMARALAGAGHEVGMAVNDPQVGPPAGPWQRFVVRAGECVSWDRVPSTPLEREALAGFRQALDDFSPDAVSVHNIHGGARVGWSVDMVRLCADRVPTIWTLHDTWSFTGRCAYLDGCGLFPDGCGADCPTPGEYPFLAPERVPDEFARKRDVLGQARFLAAAAPSRWMAGLAAEGLWRGREVRCVPNCLDTDVFSPGDRAAARQGLGVAAGGRVVLLCAADFSDPRKGADLAVEALRLLDGELTVLVMGRADGFPDLPGVTVRRLGFVTSPERQAEAYRAADVMLHPALQDNLPNTVLEALACGTPVAGFRVGGLGDMVLDAQTGYLAPDLTPGALAEAVAGCLARAEALGRAGRAHVQAHFSEAAMADRWLALAGAVAGPDAPGRRA